MREEEVREGGNHHRRAWFGTGQPEGRQGRLQRHPGVGWGGGEGPDCPLLNQKTTPERMMDHCHFFKRKERFNKTSHMFKMGQSHKGRPWRFKVRNSTVHHRHRGQSTPPSPPNP